MDERSIPRLRGHQAAGDPAGVLAALDGLEEADLSPHQAVLKGIARHLTGDSEAARPLLDRDLGGGDAAALADEGLARLLLGQVGRARVLLEAAVAAPGADAVAHGRLGGAYLQQGALEAARRHYQEAVYREPGRAAWHSNLGGILVRQQRLEEALENYDVALRLDPDLEAAQQARQRVLMALERPEEAIEQLQERLEAASDNVAVRQRLARALAQANRLVEAVAVVRAALRPVADVVRPEDQAERRAEPGREPGSWPAQLALRRLLAELFGERDMHARVVAVANQILALEPDDPCPVIQTKARALTEMRRFEAAEALLDAAEAEHGTGSLPLCQARAHLYTESGRFEEAEALQRGLLAAYPGNARLKTQLGQTLLWTGKLDEAAGLFEEAAGANPMALAQMVSARRIPEDPAALRRMATIADNPLVPDPARIAMGFALAGTYDSQGDYDRAFHYLDLANRLTDKKLNYDPARFSARVDAHMTAFSEDFLARQPAIRPSDRTPVFVVGMPRSGTTLTEQILCSHPQVFGAGELSLLPRLTRLMPKVTGSDRPYPQCVADLTPHLREEAARFYLNGLDQHNTEHPFVVDKLPHNFMQLGLIALIFPKAKIIHVQRDPRDTALSNLQQNFKARFGALGYAFDQAKIAAQINDYHRLMAHWRAVLPLPTLEVAYEDLVTDQEGVTRQLLAFLGVDWDESVRDFHKTERAVRTASVAQVRQPIYQRAKQKWRRYEAHLGPLLANLDPATYAEYDAPSGADGPSEEGAS